MVNKISHLLSFCHTLKENSLHFYFDNGDYLDMSAENIESICQSFWNSSSIDYHSILNESEFQKCGFCLSQHQKICDAIKPLIALSELIGKHFSYEKLIVVWKKRDGRCEYLEKDLQSALDEVALLSMTNYCTQSQKYAHYFTLVKPFMDLNQVVEIIFKNIFASKGGDKNKIKKEIERFNKTIETTTSNKINRMNLITKTDAVLNALVRSSVPIQLLNLKFDDLYNQFSNKQILILKSNEEIQIEKEELNQDHLEINVIFNKMKEHLSNSLLIDYNFIFEKLTQIYHLAKKHFNHEEYFLRNLDYVFLDYHQNSHEEFLNILIEFLKLDSLKDPHEIKRFIYFLETWLHEHIMELDHDYISCYPHLS